MKLPTDIVRAARGAAAIVTAARAEAEQALLAYVAVYACGYTGRGSLDTFNAVGSARRDAVFLAQLVEAVPDRVTLSDWTVTGWNDDRVFLEKDAIRTFIARRRLKEDHLVVGRPVSFTRSALALDRMPGFVMRRGIETSIGHPHSRLYLNIRPEAAAWVLGPLARRLDHERLPFVLKVLAHPRAYRRRDACVIYVISEQLGAAFDVVWDALAQARLSLDDPVPLFTKKLAPGMGFAEDLSDLGAAEQSYGQWVSWLFLKAAATSDDARHIARAVMDEVRACGRDPHRPYLRAGRSEPVLNRSGLPVQRSGLVEEEP